MLQPDDSTYIRKLLEIVYRDEEHKLPFRSLNGCPEGFVHRNKKTFFREKKLPISPEKRVLINSIFRQRIRSSKLPLEEKSERTKQSKINVFIAKSIVNIRRSKNLLEGHLDLLIEKDEIDEQ